MSDNYYIESVKESGEDNSMYTGVISAYNHGGCVEVHGSRKEFSKRLTDVLSGLNGWNNGRTK